MKDDLDKSGSDSRDEQLSEESPSGLAHRQSSGLASFWAELKRRKVMRVAITYAVVAWLIMQVAGLTFENFDIPVWAFRFVVIMLVCFFPVAVILAWAFELTPDGIKTTKHARQDQGEVPVSEKQERKRNWFSLLFAAAVPTLIFGVLAAVFFYKAKSSDSELSALSSSLSAIDKSIAVLPFTNMSPDAENAYFADGIHETILTTLANLGDLRVVSRTSVMPYRDSGKPIPSIGRELNVAYILEGSVQRVGNDFRLTTQLIQAGTDEHLWAKNYDGEFKEVFAVQSQLAREISESLKAVLSPEENERLNKQPTENLEAYDLYLKALTFGYRSVDADELLDKAVALDPNFTLAWARMGMVYSTRFFLGDDRSEETRQKAKDAIYAALDLEPENPRVLLALGYYFYSLNQFTIAELFYSMVQKQLPNDPNVLDLFGRCLMNHERVGEAIKYFEAANRIEPGSVRSMQAYAYQLLHDWERARAIWFEIENASGNVLERQLMGNYLVDGNAPEIDLVTNLPVSVKAIFSWIFGDLGQVLKYLSPEDQTNNTNTRGGSFLLVRSPAWLYSIAQLVSGHTEEAHRSLIASRNSLQLKVEINYEDYLALSMLGLTQALLGEEEASLDAFDQLIAIRKREDSTLKNPDLFVDRAIALAWLGHKDEAVAELARLIKIPSYLNVHVMRHCLDFWPLRHHPGFQAILDDPANHQPLDLDKL